MPRNMNAEPKLTSEGTPAPVRDERAERIADGREIVDALKNKAKAGVHNMLQRLKDQFYIGVSHTFEAASPMKASVEAFGASVGNTWAAAKAGAAELMGRGREFVEQKSVEARERKTLRQQRRQERREEAQSARAERTAELDARQAERGHNREARQTAEEARMQQALAAEVANRQARELVEHAQQIAEEAYRQLEVVNRQLEEAKWKEVQARAAVESAVQAAEKAKVAAENNPGDKRLRIDVDRKTRLVGVAEADLEEASLSVGELESEADQLAAKAERAESSVESARGRMEERRQQAASRKAERVAARKEARGELWESAKDRFSRLAGDAPTRLKKIGAVVTRGAGAFVIKTLKAITSGTKRFGSAARAGASGFGQGWQQYSGSIARSTAR